MKKLISVNVGLPRVVISNGDSVSTGIFKEPVAGRVMLKTLNLDGDRQADLSVHGGPSKAVYVYPSEHYDYWKRELPEMKLPWGMFGENFTSAGLFEQELNIGDKYSVGSAVVMVTEPRMPCYKLYHSAAPTSSSGSASERTGFILPCKRVRSEWRPDQTDRKQTVSGERLFTPMKHTPLFACGN
jgi:MOSC domain-containing protein YiiM